MEIQVVKLFVFFFSFFRFLFAFFLYRFGVSKWTVSCHVGLHHVKHWREKTENDIQSVDNVRNNNNKKDIQLRI